MTLEDDYKQTKKKRVYYLYQTTNLGLIVKEWL